MTGKLTKPPRNASVSERDKKGGKRKTTITRAVLKEALETLELQRTNILWVPVLESAMDRILSRCEQSALSVYMVLRTKANWKTGEVHMSTGQIAERAKLTRPTVSKALNQLEEIDLIRRDVSAGKKARTQLYDGVELRDQHGAIVEFSTWPFARNDFLESIERGVLAAIEGYLRSNPQPQTRIENLQVRITNVVNIGR